MKQHDYFVYHLPHFLSLSPTLPDCLLCRQKKLAKFTLVAVCFLLFRKLNAGHVQRQSFLLLLLAAAVNTIFAILATM